MNLPTHFLSQSPNTHIFQANFQQDPGPHLSKIQAAGEAQPGITEGHGKSSHWTIIEDEICLKTMSHFYHLTWESWDMFEMIFTMIFKHNISEFSIHFKAFVWIPPWSISIMRPGQQALPGACFGCWCPDRVHALDQCGVFGSSIKSSMESH